MAEVTIASGPDSRCGAQCLRQPPETCSRRDLRDAEVDQVDARADKGWIELGGPEQMLEPILHTVALESLPFVVSALEGLVGLALFFAAWLLRLGNGRNGQAFAVVLQQSRGGFAALRGVGEFAGIAVRTSSNEGLSAGFPEVNRNVRRSASSVSKPAMRVRSTNRSSTQS